MAAQAAARGPGGPAPGADNALSDIPAPAGWPADLPAPEPLAGAPPLPNPNHH